MKWDIGEVCMQCVRVGAGDGVVQWKHWLCAGRFYSLCVSPFSLSPPHVIVFCINPLPSPRASRRLVCSFFSFVTPLFQKASLIETERSKKRKKKKNVLRTTEKKWNDFVSQTKTVDFSKAATMMKWSAYAAECTDCIVRPCVQNPWYCLHSPINVPLHGMILLSWRPKNWKIKKRRCLHERSERERERSTACMSGDWRTDTRAWHSVFTPIDMFGWWYYWTGCLVMSCYCLLFFFFLPLSCHHV